MSNPLYEIEPFKWFDVKDKMPHNFATVLVRTIFGDLETVSPVATSELGFVWPKGYRTGERWEVTHWMKIVGPNLRQQSSLEAICKKLADAPDDPNSIDV